MFNLGYGEILIICCVLAVVAGPERLGRLPPAIKSLDEHVHRALRPLSSAQVLILCLIVLVCIALLVATQR